MESRKPPPRIQLMGKPSAVPASALTKGAFGRMHAPIEIRLFGGRSFMGTGKKTTFMIANVRPEGHPCAPIHVSKSTYVLFAMESLR